MNCFKSLSLLSLLSLSACRHSGATIDTSLASQGDSFPANNSEIFVDKVMNTWGSHGLMGMTF